MSTFDVVIRNGRVVDGTGAPERSADVAITDGVITKVGDVDGRGAKEIDADGALVAPGWVDIHTHYDGQATWDSQLAPSSWHGATTVVFGNCGVGFAPVRPADHQRLIELMEGVEDIPGAALHEGLSWEWQSFPEYLDAVERQPHDIDAAAQVPHGALRLHVMGERGAQREKATAEDIEQMGAIARAGIEAGALGFTTSRTLNHRTSRGEPTPTLTAAADELIGIARAIGGANTGVLQVVSDFIDPDTEFGMLRDMVSESGRPLSLSLAASPLAPGNHTRLLARITEANADGLEMRAQVAARAIGLLFGLECTLNPFMNNPVYKEIAKLPAAEQAAIMREPGFKERLFAAANDEKIRKLGAGLVGMFDRMFVLGDPPDYEPDPTSAILPTAQRERRSGEDLAYDLLAQGDGNTLFYVPFLNYIDGSLDVVGEMLAHDHTVPGLSDGGAHVGTICDGSFPTSLLTMWARDRERGRLGVPFLVQRQCRDTARAVGLLDRGVLAPGYKADVNVIDFDGLTIRRPEIRFDLPAGGKRLLQKVDGYRHTFVSGIETYRDGEHTGELPGRLVRGAQPTPA
ncbi:MAG: amidohydrolase family protein [Actinobacteria bacterium]|nr:amidohydrolase family protein [Actinomycetota bacterium]